MAFKTAMNSVSAQRVCIVGLGYIGLPTAAVMADRGYDVCGVDVREDVVDTINRGEIHIVEPHLGKLVERVVSEGRLKASLEPSEADVFFICVPTPINADKSPDLTYVRSAAEAIRPFIRAGNSVILESTSPPCTTQDVVVPSAIPEELEIGRDVFVAYCPERVLPGRILLEVVGNDRVVGGMTPECTRRVKGFYETFVEGEVLATTALTAEITKLTENAFRDVNIAFANELSMLAGELGADPFEIIRLANRHPRVNILTPGPGVGGHCISVDPWFLVHSSGERTPLIRTAREVNLSKPEYVVEQVLNAVGDTNRVVGCLGLTYKPDVDDVRESPSLHVVERLVEARVANLRVCDPFVKDAEVFGLPLQSLDELLAESHVIVLLTDHRVFRNIDPGQFVGKTVIDTRGVWDEREYAERVQTVRWAA